MAVSTRGASQQLAAQQALLQTILGLGQQRRNAIRGAGAGLGGGLAQIGQALEQQAARRRQAALDEQRQQNVQAELGLRQQEQQSREAQRRQASVQQVQENMRRLDQRRALDEFATSRELPTGLPQGLLGQLATSQDATERANRPKLPKALTVSERLALLRARRDMDEAEKRAKEDAVIIQGAREFGIPVPEDITTREGMRAWMDARGEKAAEDRAKFSAFLNLSRFGLESAAAGRAARGAEIREQQEDRAAARFEEEMRVPSEVRSMLRGVAQGFGPQVGGTIMMKLMEGRPAGSVPTAEEITEAVKQFLIEAGQSD